MQRFAPEAKGHGVPEVMDAVYYRQGRIRPIVALIKAVASSLSIATSGSVGREGPIAQIGSAFGSALGQWLKLPAWERVTLIAAGAGAGIAATFNAPIGGVLFAVELLLIEVNARTLFPVALAAVLATLISRAFFGVNPSFIVTAQPAGTARGDEARKRLQTIAASTSETRLRRAIENVARDADDREIAAALEALAESPRTDERHSERR